MSWFLRFIDSSIGKKLVMGLTGFFLLLFLLAHLAGNLALFRNDGGEAFNLYAKTLRGLPGIIILEIGLGLIFLFHIANGIRLSIQNARAKSGRYAVPNKHKDNDVASRTMIHTGICTFIFLVIHLKTFFVEHNILQNEATLYDLVVSAFTNELYSAFYLIAMFLLAFHLHHGFQSAFQTFGWNHKKYFPMLKTLGTLYAIIVSVLFAAMPVYIYIIHGGK